MEESEFSTSERQYIVCLTPAGRGAEGAVSSNRPGLLMINFISYEKLTSRSIGLFCLTFSYFMPLIVKAAMEAAMKCGYLTVEVMQGQPT